MYESATNTNKLNILSLLERNSKAKLLDLGCNDGKWTKDLAEVIGTSNQYGIEIVDKAIEKCRKNKVKVKKGDLNRKFPFDSSYFDVVHANQVIEHVAFIDAFIDEIYRVLKPSGYVIISTENASSWHNIFASIMGWQIFSLTNVSTVQCGIGNPFAVHREEKLNRSMFSWTHKTVFNYLGLKEIFEVHRFKNVEIKGAGYYPFPAVLGRFDVRHAHFLALKATKSNP